MKPDVLAIIKNVKYGVNVIGKVSLSFTTYIDENSAARQFLFGDDATKLIKESGVEDVHDLNGKTCWVAVDDLRITYKRFAKI